MSPRPSRLFRYRDLMPHLVREILMVASPYDCFILEEDGRFSDRLLSQYVDLDLSAPPHFSHAASARAALDQLQRERFDLVLTTPHCADMRVEQLLAEVSRHHPLLPVVVLSYDVLDAQQYSQLPRSSGLAESFLWTGEPKLLVALVKSVEDMRNVDHDTEVGLVRVIIVVEDSPSFYSSYLPIIYSEVLGQFQSLLAERLNERDRRHRMRARPKILLARNYEEAVELFQRYQAFLLGVICDMRFPRNGKLDPDAGLDFIRLVRTTQPDAQVLLQSRERDHLHLAEQLRVQHADKRSPELLAHLRDFIRKNFGFGPFIFQDAHGREVERAEDMAEMLEVFKRVPADSLQYHASRNHISNWLMARSEFGLALEVRPKKVSDFKTTEEMRRYLIDSFATHMEWRQRGEIVEFARRSGPVSPDFARIGSGSMGGKARGIAFVSHLLAEHDLRQRYPEINIVVPRTVVIGTDVFDRFCEHDRLRQRAIEAGSEEEVVRLFLEQPLPPGLTEDLAAILDQLRDPLAVRSSSLHEDSEYLPLAGLFRSFMLPNCAVSERVRLQQLARAMRLVFAAPFQQPVRSYIESHGLRLEEEKMGVIIQRLVGRRHGDRFYPDFAGVVQSHNFYPLRYLKPEDGIATVALGLGQTIVQGHKALRFSPRFPQVLPQMSTPRDALRASQRDFYALDLSRPLIEPLSEEDGLLCLDLEAAEQDGTLAAVGATYSPDNDTVYDTIYRSGARIVSFAGVLKHDLFPLAPLLCDLLEMGTEGLGMPIEMEFAVALHADRKPEMAVLQLRPLVTQGHESQVDLERIPATRVPVIVGTALGNGVMLDVQDIVYIEPHQNFDAGRSAQLAQEIGRINHRLAAAGRSYILIGPGRWGTADPWLGVPVAWTQVSAARVIVELELPGSHIDASQGTHFFHNLTSLRIGYFGVDLGNPDHLLDLDWLRRQPAEEEVHGIRQLHLKQPLEVHIDGRRSWGMVVRAREEG